MKSNTMARVVLVAFCLGVSGLPFLSIQAAPKSNNGEYKPPILPPAIKRMQAPNFWKGQREEFKALTNDTWADEQWTGNDEPYITVRTQIEQAFDRNAQPKAVVTQYEESAKREPNNPLSQFGWAYAVRLATKSPSFLVDNTSDLLTSVNIALAEAPSPHTYNYDRLRYLIWLQWGNGAASHFLKNMAYRLLQRNPKDFPVLQGLASIYTQNEDKGAQKTGFSLIQKLIRNYPSKPEVYDMLGGWYYTQYMFYHNPKNYHLAMSNYQKALGMYPAASPRRAGLPEVMDFLTQRYHQISAGGT
jgi:tetratricopeptide (TPR) repeat protein